MRCNLLTFTCVYVHVCMCTCVYMCVGTLGDRGHPLEGHLLLLAHDPSLVWSSPVRLHWLVGDPASAFSVLGLYISPFTGHVLWVLGMEHKLMFAWQALYQLSLLQVLSWTFGFYYLWLQLTENSMAVCKQHG